MKPGSVWEYLPEKRKEGWEGTPSTSEKLAGEVLKFAGHDWGHVDERKLFEILEKLVQKMPIHHNDYRWILKDQLPKTTERVHMLLSEDGDGSSWLFPVRGVDDLGNHSDIAQLLEQLQTTLGRPGSLWEHGSDAESSQPVRVQAVLVGNHLNDPIAGRHQRYDNGGDGSASTG